MKLTRKNLIELIRLKDQGWTSYQVKKKVGVTVRRIDQIYKKYKETGKVPELGKNVGRPLRPIILSEEKIIKEAYQKYNI